MVVENKVAPVGLRYERKGQCRQCGACCANEDCEHFVLKGDIAVCAIHPSIVGEDKREPKCDRFPQAPPIVFKTCGYWFVDTWDENRVVRPGEV